jgi:4-amino-4-deoxy-L-arabinose transferase-like glycosyltransferase
VEPPSSAGPRGAKSRFVSISGAILWASLIVATLYVCYFTHLSSVGLVGPDEPRYAWIARDMAESGDFVTPRLYGKPWFEKPPLYYWSAAVSFKLFGVNEFSARFPTAIFALLATFSIAWLAWRLYGAEIARWLLVLLPTTVGMIGFSHAAATDMPFAATLALAMCPAAILLGLVPTVQPEPTDSSPYLSAALFGFFIGLAVVAKGPAAVILCGGAVLLWALFTKRWRDTRRLLHLAAIAAFCVTALPWYILCAVRNPDFLRIFILEHNFKRFLTPEFQHIQPFWFYGQILPLAFLPWTAVLLWAVAAGLLRMRAAKLGPPALFLLCWAGFCVAFFTVSRSKLPGYVLPAIPPIALLVARAGALLTQQKLQRRSLALTTLAFAVLSASLFTKLWGHPELYLKHSSAFAPLVDLALFLLTFSNLFLSAGLFFARRNAAMFTAVIPVLAALYIFDVFAPFTPLSIQSPRYIAEQLASEQLPPEKLRAFKLKRATLYGLSFYLHHEIQDWDGDPTSEVYVLTQQQSPPCVDDGRDVPCAELWSDEEQVGDLRLLHLTPKR